MIKTILFDPFGRLRNGWWFLIFFLIMAAILGVAMLAAWKFQFELGMPLQAMIILLASWLCQRMRKRSLAELLGNFDLHWLKQFLFGSAMGSALMLFPALFLAGLGLVHWHVNPNVQSTILPGLLLCISVAVAEELMFRGFIFQRFINGLGVWPAQLLMAAWFLLTHLNNPGMTGSVKFLAGINIFLASIMFGLAFLYTKSLAMPIGLHFMANWMQGSLLGFGVSGNNSLGFLIPEFDQTPAWLAGGQFGLEASIPGLVCVIAAIVFLYRWKPASGSTPDTAVIKNYFT
jgi:uncharacterized protein